MLLDTALLRLTVWTPVASRVDPEHQRSGRAIFSVDGVLTTDVLLNIGKVRRGRDLVPHTGSKERSQEGFAGGTG